MTDRENYSIEQQTNSPKSHVKWFAMMVHDRIRMIGKRPADWTWTPPTSNGWMDSISASEWVRQRENELSEEGHTHINQSNRAFASWRHIANRLHMIWYDTIQSILPSSHLIVFDRISASSFVWFIALALSLDWNGIGQNYRINQSLSQSFDLTIIQLDNTLQQEKRERKRQVQGVTRSWIHTHTDTYLHSLTHSYIQSQWQSQSHVPTPTHTVALTLSSSHSRTLTYSFSIDWSKSIQF